MQKIYEAMDPADCAFIMHKGKLVFEISPNDRYHLEGKEIIFGSEEPLIARRFDMDQYFRFQSAYVESSSLVDKIPLENLYKVISIFNIGFGITKNIARFVEITNKIYVGKEKKLSGKDVTSKEYALVYADTIDRLKDASRKVKNEWLKDVVDRYSNSLVYTKGEAFKRSSPKTELKLGVSSLKEYTFNVSAGSILCEEGDLSNEMFILNRGLLEVSLGGKKVANISESGSVIGEMALLLGERRSATIKTISEANITIIKPENLSEVARKDKNFFLNLASNMGKRLEHNCNIIRETDDLLAETDSLDTPLPPKERSTYKELLSFIRELERYELKYKNQWLADIVSGAKKSMAKTRELPK
jgi:CRP-like cAMP-binding protein